MKALFKIAAVLSILVSANFAMAIDDLPLCEASPYRYIKLSLMEDVGGCYKRDSDGIVSGRIWLAHTWLRGGSDIKFLVDGEVRQNYSMDRRNYWNTKRDSNGSHVVQLTSISADSDAAGNRFLCRLYSEPITVSVDN